MTAGANALLHLFDAAQLDEREAPRLGGGNSVPHFVRRGHLDERTHFVVEPLLGSIPAKNPRQHRGETMDEAHAPSSTLAIANEMRSQRCLCCSSCRRPDAVSA